MKISQFGKELIETGTIVIEYIIFPLLFSLIFIQKELGTWV